MVRWPRNVMRKEEKRSPNGLLFYFSMKVLLLKTNKDIDFLSKETVDREYVRIVNEIKTNAVTMIPPFVRDTEVVDIDTVAFDNDGKLLFTPFRTEGGPNV